MFKEVPEEIENTGKNKHYEKGTGRFEKHVGILEMKNIDIENKNSVNG